MSKIKLWSTLVGILIVCLCCYPCDLDNSQFFSKDQIHPIEVIPLNTGQKFRFKGLSVDVGNENIYLGSWDKKELVVVSLKDKTHKVIPTNYSGRLNGMGVYLKHGKLYAVMNEVDDKPEAQPLSVLLVIDVSTGTVLHSYEAKAVNGRNHFNHVVVDNNGIAYISNTLKSNIFTVDTKDPADKLKKLVEHKDLSMVHGIDISPDGTRLFSTSYTAGIKFYDLKSKTFSSFTDTSTSENDGLKYYGGYLYGIGKNALKRYTLNEAGNAIVKTEVLLSDHEFFNDPRCLHIENGWVYCLANIEFQLVDVGRNTRIDKKPFTDTYVLKLKIN
jgi:hypothetical protein